MGRLVAAVIALAVFLTGAMYWSQAHQDAEQAPDCVYPCAKATVQPARSKVAQASEGDKTTQTEDESKQGCAGGCCHNCGGK